MKNLRNKIFSFMWRKWLKDYTVIKITGWRSCLADYKGSQRVRMTFLFGKEK